MREYDIAILGGGSGGYVAAIRAAKMGVSVALIEKDKVGGTCLNRGCIPTKVMIEAGHRYNIALNSSEYGVDIRDAEFNYKRMLKTREEVVKTLRDGVLHLLKKLKVDLIEGYGELTSENTIMVDGVEEIRANNIILATGSKPSSLPGLEIDNKYILTSDDILELEKPPARLIVVGAGAIGCEFAYIFANIGVKVYLVELLDRAIPGSDKRASRVIASKLKSLGVKLSTETTIKRWTKKDGCLEATLEDGIVIEAECILLSVGRVPNTNSFSNIGGIKLNNGGFVETDEYLHTGCGNIYAIGDILPRPMLAHKAFYEGVIAVENILGYKRKVRYDIIPSVVYTIPEIAQVGPTEDELKESGYEYTTSTFHFRALGRALAMGETDGFVKIISGADGRILSGTIVGLSAGELIGEISLAILSEMKADEFKDLVHSHPTLSEATGEALWGLSERMIHSL